VQIKINFASRDYVIARKAYVVLALCIAVSALVFIANYRGYNSALEKEARLTGRLKSQETWYRDAGLRLERIKKTVSDEDVKAAAREANFANEAIARRTFSWTLFLNRLEEVVPDGVGIKSIKPNFVTLDVDISGTALDVEPLVEFVDRMTRSPYFEDIPPILHTTKTVVDKDVGKTLQEFNFKIRYLPEGKGAEDKTKAKGAGKG